MRFRLTDCNDDNCSCWLAPGTGATVLEHRKYSLAVYDSDSSAEYRFYVGDDEIEVETYRTADTFVFSSGMYFESASGMTDVTIVLASIASSPTVLHTTLYVCPSKIGEANYKSMVRDLEYVCRALVMDTEGKSRNANAPEIVATRRKTNTPVEELISITTSCKRLAPVLAEIERAPKAAMRLAPRPTSSQRAHSPRAISAMMKRGLDPTSQGPLAVNFSALRPAETFDIPEHRLLKAFLLLMLKRISDCQKYLSAEIHRIEGTREFRSKTVRGGDMTLYEKFDAPHMRRLKERDNLALQCRLWLETELGSEFWKDVGTSIFSPESSQFAENEFYLEAANIILRYLRDPAHFISFTKVSNTKRTWKMYEQWVLVQLVTAFRNCGLGLPGWETIRGAGPDSENNLAFDFLNDTTFTAPFGERHEIAIRYTPWIFPAAVKWAHPRETICHHRDRDHSTWTPDIVIELRRKTPDGPKTVYAVVLDAKYSREPKQEMYDSVSKYSGIRTTEGQYGKRVAHQVWIVYPGTQDMRWRFRLDDIAMWFTPRSGIIYRDTDEAIGAGEQIFGELIAMPGERMKSPQREGVVPKTSISDFASGTLAFFRKLASYQPPSNML